MKQAVSLRLRLTAIILIPLLIIAGLIGLWAIQDARDRASTRFDLGLLSAALSVSRDVAVSGGDALSPETSTLLRNMSGGPVFYHVYAPDGVFVTGYATPPVTLSGDFSDVQGQRTYDGVHQSRPVRALRFIDTMQIDGLSGDFTVTVWQDRDVLRARIRALSTRTLGVIGLLVASVACVVWFGVRHGMRPLIDLEEAIEQRSVGDLSAIKRAVPDEVGGIVATLNRLLAQVSQAMTAQSDFIANAAHQLRNPIAGVLSLAESVAAAKTPEQSKARADDLLRAAQDTADLTQKLLMLERAEAMTPAAAFSRMDLAQSLPDWIDTQRTGLPDGLRLELECPAGPLWLNADSTMLREAITNLIDNAVRHAGPTLSRIAVQVDPDGPDLRVIVQDDGQGIPEDQMQHALERFVRLSESQSSGLGLSIVAAIVRGHGGTFALRPSATGLHATLSVPRLKQP